jgi:hypothetical protein
MRAAVRPAIKNDVLQVPKDEIKPTRAGALERISSPAHSKPLLSLKSQRKRVAKGTTKSTSAIALKRREKQNTAKQSSQGKGEWSKEKKIIEEETGKRDLKRRKLEGDEDRRRGSSDRLSKREEPKGFWLCKKHGVWIDPSHPLY